MILTPTEHLPCRTAQAQRMVMPLPNHNTSHTATCPAHDTIPRLECRPRMTRMATCRLLLTTRLQAATTDMRHHTRGGSVSRTRIRATDGQAWLPCPVTATTNPRKIMMAAKEIFHCFLPMEVTMPTRLRLPSTRMADTSVEVLEWDPTVRMDMDPTAHMSQSMDPRPATCREALILAW